MLKANTGWLTQRVDSPPTSYHGDLPEMAGLRARMAWQRLKREAHDGDEIWAFVGPAAGWRQAEQSGFALVRSGEVVQSVAVTRG